MLFGRAAGVVRQGNIGRRCLGGAADGRTRQERPTGAFNYTYDSEGNLLTKTEIATSEVTEYTWDYRNRLTNVTLKNSFGSVIQESDYAPGGNMINHIAYDSFGNVSSETVPTEGDRFEFTARREP